MLFRELFQIINICKKITGSEQKNWTCHIRAE